MNQCIDRDNTLYKISIDPIILFKIIINLDLFNIDYKISHEHFSTVTLKFSDYQTLYAHAFSGVLYCYCDIIYFS